MKRFGRTRVRAAAALLVLLPAGAPEARAQERATVSGTVVDAYNQAPLPEASVVLETRGPGALPAPGRALVQATRTVRTDAGGRYHFSGVPAGEYRLRVERPGYRSATVEVDLRGAAESRVSVGLDVEPVALRPVEVSVPAVDPAELYGRRSRSRDAGAAGNRRVEVERARQDRYLASDVRAVTHADVAQGITLGETDLFRALQRLPGVSAGDEYSAELWTRGAPWDQTRVYFDGLPLFNPVHAVGGFSGVNPDAVGAAFLHPGVQPASLGGGAAGVLDLRSRPGGGSGELRGLAELSVVSARGALDRSSGDGRRAWMAAGRRTYLDLATGAAERLLGRDKTYHLPYTFSDLTGRWDHPVGEEGALEVSGLLELDRISSTNTNLLDRISADWGGGMARATLQNRLGGVRARHTLGLSGFFSSLDARNQAPRPSDPGNIHYRPEIEPTSSGILYTVFRGELEPVTSPSPLPWQAGYELANQRVSFAGPRPLPLALVDPDARRLDREHALSHAALWGSRRWRPAEALTLTTAMRLEAGPAVRGGGVLRLAPRVAARLQATPALALSAAAGRSFQYVQAVVPSGAPVNEAFRSDYLWVLAGDSVPAARADVATIGAEHWLGDGWLGAATGYARRTTGVALPDPTPGPLRERPLLVGGVNHARGVELSLRRLTGRWTASAAYSYGVSEIEAAGLRFPAPWDQRHVLDLTAMLQVSPRWQVGAAYTAAGGTPYTETFQGRVACRGDADCEWAEEPRAGEPGARRLPAYQSLDLLAEWRRSYRRWDLGVFVQVHNALDHDNPGRYLGFGGEYCVASCTPYRPEHDYTGDDFTAGLPAFPVIGARATF